MIFDLREDGDLKKAKQLDETDRKRLAKLERDLEGLRPQWLELQEQAEELCSRYANNDRSYQRGIHEPWWKDREAALRSQIDQIAAERDKLTEKLPGEITALKQRIHQRHEIVSGAFSVWAQQIGLRLPPWKTSATSSRPSSDGSTKLLRSICRSASHC